MPRGEREKKRDHIFIKGEIEEGIEEKGRESDKRKTKEKTEGK